MKATLEAAKRGVLEELGPAMAACDGTAITLDTERIHYSNLTLLASFHHTPATIRKALEHIEAGRIRAEDFVTGECTLNELPTIFQEMTQGNRAVKTLIHTQPDTH